MKVKELMEHLAEADPEAEVITDTWNGRISTYMVLDHAVRVDYDVLKSDFFGTPGAFDKRLHQVESGKFFYIGSTFTNGNSQAFNDRCFILRLLYDLDIEESDDVKAARLLQMLRNFDEGKGISL